MGGDVRRLRALRNFLDGLDAYECTAIGGVAPGLNALVGRPWAAALLLDDLPNVRPEQLVATARALGNRTPVIGLTLSTDPHRAHALYQAGAVEVISLEGAPLPHLARAVARTIERQVLVDRVTELEGLVDDRDLIDPESGLYPAWRMDEELTLESSRAQRRRGDVALLTIEVITVPGLERLPPSERAVVFRKVGAMIRGQLRDGDVVSHDGDGRFRSLLVDSGTMTTEDIADAVRRSVRHGFETSGMSTLVTVDVVDAHAAARALGRGASPVGSGVVAL